MANRFGNNGNSDRLNFVGSQITADGDCNHEIKRCLLLGRKAMANLDSILKKQRHYFDNKVPSNQGYGFSSCHAWIRELDDKEGCLVQFNCSVMSDSVTPWTAASQSPLSIIKSQSLLKFMSTESGIPSNHLIFCHPFFFCLQSFPASGSFLISRLFISGGQSIGASGLA